MGLKEPEILNELAEGMRARALSEEALRTVVQLLARPFASGEKVVIKPSNVVNVLAPSLLELDPGSNAIFLFAPLPRFLRSIADKGLWGRRWVVGSTPSSRGIPGSTSAYPPPSGSNLPICRSRRSPG